EQMLELSRQEWARSVAFETYEKQHDRNAPELTMAASTEEEVARGKRDELAIRKFLADNRILTVPPDIPHYELRAMPNYLAPLSDFTEMDDFTGLSRMNDRSALDRAALAEPRVLLARRNQGRASGHRPRRRARPLFSDVFVAPQSRSDPT